MPLAVILFYYLLLYPRAPPFGLALNAPLVPSDTASPTRRSDVNLRPRVPHAPVICFPVMVRPFGVGPYAQLGYMPLPLRHDVIMRQPCAYATACCVIVSH